MRLLNIFSCLILTLITIGANAAKDYTLKLKVGDFDLQPISASENLSKAANENNLNGYAFIQFNEIPTSSEKVTLATEGIHLLEYIPNQAFIANVSNVNSSKTLGEFQIRSISPYIERYKVATRLSIRDTPDWAKQGGSKVDLTLDLQLDKSIESINATLNSIGAEILEIGLNGEYLNLRISENNIPALISAPFTKFLDYVPAPPEKEDTRGRSLHRGNLLDSDDPLGRKYDGTGVSIAIADDGLIGPHIDFTGRVTQFTTVDNGTHGDMTSGIAIGAGNLDPTIRGMATGADLFYYSISGYPHIANAVTNLNTRGVVITSTSYSQGCNNYESTARSIDQQVRQNPELLHVFSAGNSSSSNCGYGAGTPWGTITGGRKQGKAVIATGNLDYRGNLTNSSSRGPSEDGRIKPDICANGTNQMSTDPNNNYRPGGGTSAAAPGIAGLAAQLYHGFRDLNNGINPESGLIKAAMLNTARDIGNPGPDYFYGWGRVNAHRAMKLLEENRYLDSSISQAIINTHSITIPNNLEELRVMVYWTDFEGSTVSSKALVNDLDIRLTTPSNSTFSPWTLNPAPNSTSLSSNAVRGNDNLNNVEQVTINNATAGTYTLAVNGTSIPQGPQKYFVVWETKEDTIEVTYPHGGESFVPGETETIRWDAVGNNGSFVVEYSVNNGSSWSTLGSTSGNRRYINWGVPNITSGNCLIRVSRNSKSGTSSSNFSIMRLPTNLSYNYLCPDSIELTWGASNGASEYIIYQLGQKYMDSIGITSTTTFKLYNIDLSQDNWFSVKAIGPNIKGRRTTALKIMNSPFNCPIDYDLAITQISDPIYDYVPSCNISKQAVRVTLNNAGDSTLQNIPMKLYGGGTIYYDTVPGPIPPNGFQFFTFSDSVTINPGPFNLSVAVDYSLDQNPTNDSVSKSVDVVTSTLISPPYTFDFETFSVCPTTNNCGNTNCSLNGGWLNLNNGTYDDIDMRTDIGGTPSNGTGPSFDHNPGTASGKYIYTEASNCFNSEAIFLSPCFDLRNTINPEFSFWYHMEGGSMGILRIDIIADGVLNSNIVSPIFGNQGTTWNQQLIDLSNYVGQVVNIRFRATTGSGFESDIAIDDVSLIDQSTGLSENEQNNYSIYPNPSNGTFNINFSEAINSEVRVLDIQGRVVKRFRMNNSTQQVDLSALDKGIYFINFIDEGINEKIIIQ